MISRRSPHPEGAVPFSDKLDSKFSVFSHRNVSSWTHRRTRFHVQRCVTDGGKAQWTTWSMADCHVLTPVASEICPTHNGRLSLELLVSPTPRTVHEGHSDENTDVSGTFVVCFHIGGLKTETHEIPMPFIWVQLVYISHGLFILA